MKIVKLQGGLGNQMFQYVFAKALEKNTGEKVLFDRRIYDKRKCFRPYMLDIFNTSVTFANRREINRCQQMPRISLPFFKKKKVKFQEKLINQFCPELLEVTGDAYYSGYFQSLKYFEGIEEEIRHDFTFTEVTDSRLLDLKKYIESIKSPVFISVRYGRDYADLDWLCSPSYYAQATEYIKQLIPDAHFIAIADEKDKIDIALKDVAYPYEIMSSPLEGFDIFLLSSFKHAILSNSSYAWWGAWLIDNPDKIICSPDPWLSLEEKVELINPKWKIFPRY